MGTQSSLKRGRSPPIFGPRLLWPNGYMDQDATWHGGSPRPTRHCVLWAPAPPPLKGHSPQFLANVRCGQTAGWTKRPVGMEVGLGSGDFVFDGTQLYPRKKGTLIPTQCLAHVYCGQTAGWIKTPMYGSRPWPTPHCDIVLDGVPALRERGTAAPAPLFGSCLLWPRSPGSATAELLYQPSPQNGSPYAIGPLIVCPVLSVLSVTLVYRIVAKRLDGSRCHSTWR